MSKPTMMSTRLLAGAIALLCVTPVAIAQSGSGMSEQLARMSGGASVADQLCGGASEQKASAGKAQQKALLARRGMDGAAFDKAYAAGASDARRKWEAMTPARQAEACAKLKKMADASAAAAGQLGD